MQDQAAEPNKNTQNQEFFANQKADAALNIIEDITTALLPGRFHSAQRTMAPLGTT
jgi:hypothetical protein